MKRMIVIVVVLTWFVMSNIASAKELLPWETENIAISTSGEHSVKVDDRRVYFEIPSDLDFKAGQALEVLTRGGKYDDWLKRHGEYQKGCFGMSRNFYPLGIPLLGIDAQFSISAQVYVTTSPANRANPRPSHDYRGDFSKPEELLEYLRRHTNHYVDKSKIDLSTHLVHFFSPVEEAVINGRKWYHYLHNGSLYPNVLNEFYFTGLAPDRYLEIHIQQYPVPLKAIGYPYPATGYPIYPTEAQMPGWMKKTHKYKEQVINSIRITKQAGSTEPDLYEVETLISPAANTGGTPEIQKAPEPN